MKNYTHVLAVQSMRIMEKNKIYSDKERIVITYGIELLLNSLLKACIYIWIGFLFHRSWEVLISIVIFGLIRKFSGGVHAKTDSSCFVLTGCIIMLAALAPLVWSISVKGCLIVSVILNVVYFIKAPHDTYYECLERYQEKTRAKWITLIIINIFFLVGIILGDYWRTIIFVAIIGQGITLCGGQE